MEFLTPTVSFDLFMDDYFTSFSLFVCLPNIWVNKTGARGVLNKNRLHKYTIIREKQLQKQDRDHFEQRGAHQAKTLCNLCRWLEQQQGALHSFFWILPT